MSKTILNIKALITPIKSQMTDWIKKAINCFRKFVISTLEILKHENRIKNMYNAATKPNESR